MKEIGGYIELDFLSKAINHEEISGYRYNLEDMKRIVKVIKETIK